MDPSKVVIELSRAEAIVLYDWLFRFNKNHDQLFQDQAEQRVLWDLEATLESMLVEPFDPGYQKFLAAARDRVRDAEDKGR